MIHIASFAGKNVAVLGLGKSGLAAARALVASGAKVMAWDDTAASREAAAAAQIPLADLRTADLAGVAALVMSPGIPHSFPAPHDVAARAKAQGIDLISDVELLMRSRRDASFIGITGTNGKSTTTALIGHILNAAKRATQIGGNIGTAALSLEPLGRDGIYVIEMSSYQLELVPTARFDGAVLLNISPDHLDRHGGMDGYVAAKRNIFRDQKSPRFAVVGIDDDISASIYADLVEAGESIVIPISGQGGVQGGVYAQRGGLWDSRHGEPVRFASLADCPALPGTHNAQNAAAAAAVALQLGVSPKIIADAMKSFPGLPHRQERVAERDGIVFVNDSKATNADSTAKALGCYPRIHWIAGGRAKAGGIESLRGFFPRIAKAYLIGEAAGDFAATLGEIPHEKCGTLDKAVAAAWNDARGEGKGVILLSPACASFDQFKSFEHRGDAFRDLARDIAQQGSAAA
ncbi:MAG: UDP-N-acetylmuramoyl-L-alanine--D-glutamate ligase [Tagaea sp. CACIAM 22H2]|nr:UDP-N-acetylmuramoyl-L-alanine--D-glutamate ligase [Tagaea sp. CACIAM 22H2]